MKSKRIFALAVGMGAIAGLRTMTPPAVVTWAARYKSLPIRNRRWKFLKSAKAGRVVSALAIGELAADKLPFMPNRTKPGSLAGRVVSGALCGAALSSSAKSSIVKGAVLGSLGAIAGAYAGYELRRRVRNKLRAPDAAIAAIEDALAIAGGLAIARAV